MVPGVTTQPTNESQPFVRGFQGTYSLRNGVFRRQNLTTWNVDNVEVIQGPSSIFYSNIRPGGVINYNTIKPVLGQNFADITVSGGSYNDRSSEFAYNAGNDKFAVRVDAGTSNTNSFRLSNNEAQSFLSFAATWQITPNQSVTLEAATESVHRVNGWSAYAGPATNSRYWQNPVAIASGQSVTTWMAANYPGMPAYDMYAPFYPSPGDPYGRVTPIMSQYQSGMDKPVDLTYTAKITDNLVFNTIINYAWEDNEGINPVLPDILANGTFTGVKAQRFVNVRDSYNVNARLTYRFNLAGVNNTLMAGDDNQWVIQRYPQVAQLNFPSNPANPITVGADNTNSPTYTYNPLTMGAANGYALVASGNTYNALRDTLQDFAGAYIVDQAVLLNKSLYLVAGDRYTNFRQHIWWPGRGDLEAHVSPDALYKKWTPQYGGLYKIAGGPVSLFYTHSQSLIPQTQIDATGATVTPIVATGWDAGAKFELLSGALTGTVDYYSIFETNTAISDSASNLSHGLPSNATYGYYFYGNAQQVKGLQVDLSYNVSKENQLVVGFNHFYEFDYIAPNSNPLIIGLPIAPLPETNYNVWDRHQFASGPLKGLILGGGFHYNARTIVGGGNFNYSQFYTPSFTVYDAMIGYPFKAFGHTIKAQFLVKNLSNLIYRDAGGSFGNPRTFILSASTRF
jgi:outer membrane receptor protein involved in Fe transport